MGRFKKNMAMVNNQGIDVVVNKSRLEEPLLKLKKRSKPLKVSPQISTSMHAFMQTSQPHQYLL